MIIQRVVPFIASALALAATLAGAAPVTVSNPGYYLDTVGTNSIGIAGGGSASGTRTTVFTANTLPSGGAGGTTGSATISGFNTTVGYSASENLWARRALLDDFQRNALTVTFANGGDLATVVTRDLFGLNAMPLAPSFTISGDPYSPLLSWTLPDAAGVDIDRVGLVFYNDDTNTEVGTRVFLSPLTTSYQLQSVLPEGLNLVFNLRLFDLDDRILPGEGWANGDILAQSRTYLTYTVPNRIPEPGALSLVLLAGFAAAVVRRRETR